jgi:hypothetical protein
MVETFDNFMSPEDLSWLKQDMCDRINGPAHVDRPFDPDLAEKKFGVRQDILDRRIVLHPSDPAFELIRTRLEPIIPAGVELYMAYQRQFLPHQLHVDSVYHPDTNMNYIKSAVLPLDENINGVFKTIVWNQFCKNYQELMAVFQLFIDGSLDKLHDLSETEDVGHCWDTDPNIVDYMPVDGVYHYKLGSLGMFDRAHVHCSSNWRKYGIAEYKDIVILHIG